jgi:hypothetical protein
MPLTPHGRREAEIDKALHERNARNVLELASSYGLSAGERVNLASELRRRAATTVAHHWSADLEPDDEVEPVRVVADVWREGLRRS